MARPIIWAAQAHKDRKEILQYRRIYEETALRIEILAIWDTRRDPEALKRII